MSPQVSSPQTSKVPKYPYSYPRMRTLVPYLPGFLGFVVLKRDAVVGTSKRIKKKIRDVNEKMGRFDENASSWNGASFGVM